LANLERNGAHSFYKDTVWSKLQSQALS
jgi:hypothetical protein